MLSAGSKEGGDGVNTGKTALRRCVYWLWQCSWGCLQTLAGAVVYVLCAGCRRTWYRCARVTYWRHDSGLSLGGFIFVPERRQTLRVHEYGHTVQSLLLGPLYLPAVGLPSILWAGLPFLSRLRKVRGISYFDRYPESWANTLSARITGEKPPSR